MKKPSMKPMIIDGVLYVTVAVVAFLSTVFGGEEAAKYISPAHLFWLKTGVGVASAGALALKLFRSTTYADHVAASSEADAVPASNAPAAVGQ